MNNKPALFGGKPIFKDLVPIIKPTLINSENIRSAISDLFESGDVTNSLYVQRFEEASAKYIGIKHAIAVSSATNGLMLAIKALGLSDEVIVPSFTYAATAHALVWNNIKPLFVDCEEKTFGLDPRLVTERITPKTSAIMPVYMYGLPPHIGELSHIAETHHLKLLFDSAQGFGAEYNGIKAGNFGDCEVFSFSPTNILTSIEGGMVVTKDDDLAAALRSMRDYGKGIDDMEYVGLSARMSEVHALIGLANLRNIQTSLTNRRELITFYRELLAPVEGISFQEIPDERKTSYNYMVIFVDKEKFDMSRDELFEALKAENIQTKKYFYPAVHMQKAYLPFRLSCQGKLPVTEKAAEEGLALPLYGHMKPEIVERVCEAIKRIYNWKKEPISST